MATYMAGKYRERAKPWHARAYVNRKAVSLGYYRTRGEAEAAEAFWKLYPFLLMEYAIRTALSGNRPLVK